MSTNVNFYWVMIALIGLLALLAVLGHFGIRRHRSLLWLAAGLVAGVASTFVFVSAGSGKSAFMLVGILDPLSVFAVAQSARIAVGRETSSRLVIGVALALVAATLAMTASGAVSPVVEALPFQVASAMFAVDVIGALMSVRKTWIERAMIAGWAMYFVSMLARMPFFPSLLDNGHAFPSLASPWLNWVMLYAASVFVPLIVLTIIISDVRHHIEDYRRMSDRDGLSGLYTRLAFERAADEQPHRYGAVIATDLDYFKQINDGFGHPAGDEVIRAFAALCVDASPIAARVGGEEFAVLLPGRSLLEAANIAEQVRIRFRSSEFPALAGFSCTASFGVAAYGGRVGFRDALVRADRALYSAKRHGRDCVVVNEAQGGPASPPAFNVA